MQTAEVRLAGKTLYLPYAEIHGAGVIVKGRWLRIAVFKDEELVEAHETCQAPKIVDELRRGRLRADVFAFTQNFANPTPQYDFFKEWESWAVASTSSFDVWWKSLPQESRKNVRRSEKRGVTIGVTPFSDDLVKGIQAIYDETPIRQGRRFWHFGKPFESVKAAMATYLDRSDFIGAHHGGELIGFIKVTYVDRAAAITQIIAKNAYSDARPMNALLAHAVALCQKKGMELLVYGQYVYGKHRMSPLTEFKRRNGFNEVRLPRYFVPLTIRGALALRLGLQSAIRDKLPAPVINTALKIRSWMYDLQARAR
jgi:hypothetical protein